MEKSINPLLLLQLLALNDIEITEVKMNSANEIIIRVRSTKKEIYCRRCGRVTEPYGKGRLLKLRHLPILGKKTFIEIIPPRGKCHACDNHPTTTQTLDWFEGNAHYTKAYEQHVLLSLINSTLSDVSIKENISETAIQNIVDKYINEKVNWKLLKKLGILAIDEISLKKGYQDYVTIITCRVKDEIRILAIIKGREKAAVKAFLASIPKKKQKTITAVCCDMYDGFINAAREVFGSSIPVVIDRFHVAKLYRKSLTSLRIKELARLRKELSVDEYKSLKEAISILVKNNECIPNKDKIELEKLFKYSPALKAAYRLTRQLTAIFNSNHRKATGEKKINEWISKASEVKYFNSFIETLEKYKNEVTNYFIDRNTSGFVEGLNNKIKVIKRRCYGIFNLKHLFQRVFLDLAGYKLFYADQTITSMA